MNTNRRSIIVWLFFISPMVVLLLLTYFVPLSSIFGWSVTLPEPGFGNFSKIAENDYIGSVLFRTLKLCLIATVISVFLAYILTYHWIYGPPLRRRIVEVAILFPFWISVLVRTFGWLMILQPSGVLNSTFHLNEILKFFGIGDGNVRFVRNEFGVIVGMVHFMVPFAVFPLSAVMNQIDTRILDAARGLGAGPVRRFFQVFLPLSMPGVIGATFIVFVFLLGFFITPTLLGGGRVVMVAEYVYNKILLTPDWGLAAAVSVSLLVIVAMMIALLLKLIRVERLVR